MPLIGTSLRRPRSRRGSFPQAENARWTSEVPAPECRRRAAYYEDRYEDRLDRGSVRSRETRCVSCGRARLGRDVPDRLLAPADEVIEWPANARLWARRRPRGMSALMSAYRGRSEILCSRRAFPIMTQSRRWMFGRIFGLDGRESYRELRLEPLCCPHRLSRGSAPHEREYPRRKDRF